MCTYMYMFYVLCAMCYVPPPWMPWGALAFRRGWGVFLEPARFLGKRGVAARGLEEALSGEALKTREDAQKRKFFGGARRKARERSGKSPNRNHD